MEHIIDVDALVNSNKHLAVFELTRIIGGKIRELIKDNKLHKIDVNYSIAHILCDLDYVDVIQYGKDFTNIETPEPYLFAKIDNAEIYIDPWLAWVDRFVIFDNNVILKVIDSKNILV